MKLRLGFVSNSSSSSYVIIGTYLSEISDELMDIIDRTSLNRIYIESEGQNIIGSIVSTSSSDDESVNELDIEDLQRQIIKVKDSLIKLNIDPEDVKIYHMYQSS